MLTPYLCEPFSASSFYATYTNLLISLEKQIKIMGNCFAALRKVIMGFLLIVSFTANATTYYFSAAIGNDANSGTSASTPWKTVSKFNSVFASKSPGDY